MITPFTRVAYSIEDDLLIFKTLEQGIREVQLDIERLYPDAHDRSTEVRLVELRLGQEHVYCEVSFDSKTAAHTKLDECYDVKSCFSDGLLRFDFGIRVHIA